MCREKLPKPEKLERNFTANSLINELEIQCSNRACDWTGKICNVKSHIPTCMYREGNLPKWFNDYIKLQEDEFERADQRDAINMQEAEFYLQKQEKFVPLAMRLFKPEN